MPVLTGTNKATDTKFILIRGSGNFVFCKTEKIFLETDECSDNLSAITLKCYPGDDEDMVDTLEYMGAEEFKDITNGYDLKNANIRFGKFVNKGVDPKRFAIFSNLSDKRKLDSNVFFDCRVFIQEGSKACPYLVHKKRIAIKYKSSTNDIFDKVKNLTYDILSWAIDMTDKNEYKVLDFDTLTMVDRKEKQTTKPAETPTVSKVPIKERIDAILYREANKIVNDFLEKLEAYIQDIEQSKTLTDTSFSYKFDSSYRIMQLVHTELKKHLDDPYLSIGSSGNRFTISYRF